MKNEEWLEVMQIERSAVDKQWSTFMNVVGLLYNHNFPLKLIHTRKNKISSHVNKEVNDCKNNLDILLTLSRHNPTLYKAKYIDQKKKYDKWLISKRASQYETQMQRANDKSKYMWAICRDIVGSNQRTPGVDLDGDSVDIANKYNKHLITVVPELLDRLSYVPFNCNISENCKTMFLTPVTPEEIYDIAKKIKKQTQ